MFGCGMVSLSPYVAVLIQFLLAAVIAVVILVANRIFGQRAAKHPRKDSAYECGMDPIGDPQPRFSVKFYVTAMLFILFDIEVVFLLPAVLIYREFVAAHLPIILPLMFFVSVLTMGLWYELRKGAIEWEQ
jgi:NADH-quinone oxidoreductase subunit A